MICSVAAQKWPWHALHTHPILLYRRVQPPCTSHSQTQCPQGPLTQQRLRVSAHPPWPITGVIFTCSWMLSPDFRLA